VEPGIFIARQQLGKQATIEELFGTVFSVRPMESGYKDVFS
jgi:hypothetical protein